MTDTHASSGASKPNLGRFGSFGRGVTPQQAKEIESLGYGAVWVGGSPPAELAWVVLTKDENLVSALAELAGPLGLS